MIASLRLRLAAVACALAACTSTPRVFESAVDGVALFAGAIDPATVAAFIAAHRDERITRVVVDSPGGDVAAALALANWMLDREVDVEVRGLCGSSCANYLFAPGRRKIIDDRAIVLWHGSILQNVMARMGLTGVEARAGYGLPDDLEHFEVGDAPLLSLGFDAGGQVVVLARSAP